MNNRLFLIRHGENLANLTLEFSHRIVDYPLTPKGVLQAQQTADALRGENIDAVYSSPLKRAFETAQIIAGPHLLPVTILEEFREVNVGELEKQKPTAELWQQHDGIIAAWKCGNWRAAFPGGENHRTLIQRARMGFERVFDGKSGHTAVVVAHGGIFAFTLQHIFAGLDPDQLRGNIPNCSIIEIEAWREADGLHGRVARFAAVDHLTGEAAQLVSGLPAKGELP